MIGAFKAFFTAFQQGRQLTNSATWKNRTLLTNALVAFLGALVLIAQGFGYDLQLTQETIANLAAGIAAFVTVGNSVMHLVTSAKVGLPPTGDPGPADQPGATTGTDTPDYRG